MTTIQLEDCTVVTMPGRDSNDSPNQLRVESSWSEDDEQDPSITGSTDFHVRSRSSSSTAGRTRIGLPVWLRESSKKFRWQWVPLPIRRIVCVIAVWSHGPDPPQKQRIVPFFAAIQGAPLNLVEKFLPGTIYKATALVLCYVGWILTFTLVLHRQAASGEIEGIEGYGQPSRIWCGESFWYSRYNRRCRRKSLIKLRPGYKECGMEGYNCRPFENATFVFKCPANCAGMRLFHPHPVGNQEINYRSLVIGGWEYSGVKSLAEKPTYRGDSFICQAALHAGIISNEKGGCGVAFLTGKHDRFPSTKDFGIQSIGFDSEFPKSFAFQDEVLLGCGDGDLRWVLLAVTVMFSSLLSIFVSSPAIFFFSIFVMLFFHVGLVSDPPNIADYPSLTSLCIGRFLPAAFVAFVMFRYYVKPQLQGLTAQFEKTVLWLGGAWVGSLDNYTFDLIPIQRLTPHDLQQPGALVALSVIVVLLLTIALGQAWCFRLEGRFRRYLTLYAAMGAFLIFCIIIPPLHLRIHHYILALLLLPGTSLQTRPSLLYQGILIGLFINGIARWGFDSILQTSAALFGGHSLDLLSPNITAPAVGVANITFAWALPPPPYDGLSIVINDVERHRWYRGEGDPSYTWDHTASGRTAPEKHYFRFAYMSGSEAGDYSAAGVWHANGNWTMKTISD